MATDELPVALAVSFNRFCFCCFSLPCISVSQTHSPEDTCRDSSCLSSPSIQKQECLAGAHQCCSLESGGSENLLPQCFSHTPVSLPRKASGLNQAFLFLGFHFVFCKRLGSRHVRLSDPLLDENNSFLNLQCKSSQ